MVIGFLWLLVVACGGEADDSVNVRSPTATPTPELGEFTEFFLQRQRADAFVWLIQLHKEDGVITDAESRAVCLKVDEALVQYEVFGNELEQRIRENRPVVHDLGMVSGTVAYDVDQLQEWLDKTPENVANAQVIREGCAGLGWLP